MVEAAAVVVVYHIIHERRGVVEAAVVDVVYHIISCLLVCSVPVVTKAEAPTEHCKKSRLCHQNVTSLL